MTENERKEMNNMFWWHRILLPDGTYTPGECSHGVTDIESRFGLPKDMTGKKVLDVGAWDGLFSFEAERRGASSVTAIDIYQNPKTANDPNAPFQWAKKQLNSNVEFKFSTLENYYPSFNGWKYSTRFYHDYIFYFGVLYHIDNPMGAVKKLMSLLDDNGTILLETAISNKQIDGEPNTPFLEYRPNYDNDITNKFYPNKEWIVQAFLQNGAKGVSEIYNDGQRATYRILALNKS